MSLDSMSPSRAAARGAHSLEDATAVSFKVGGDADAGRDGTSRSNLGHHGLLARHPPILGNAVGREVVQGPAAAPVACLAQVDGAALPLQCLHPQS